MNVEVYTLCHQEAKIIPYFMRHYSQFASGITLFEGHSTDGSSDLARSLGAKVINFDTNNEVRDDLFMDVKNNCWKKSKADWVIICDMDEFIYHINILEYLSKIRDTIILPRAFEMFSDIFPSVDGQIYDEVKYGFEIRSKMCLFKPTRLLEISYGAGCHDAQPQGLVKINTTNEIKLLHMRHLSIEHIVNRNAYLASRMSEINKKMGWGWHVTIHPDKVKEYFDDNRSKLIKVI
jgi:hypothetical protein